MYDVVTIGSASRDIFFIMSRGMIIPDPTSIEGKLIGFILGAKVSVDSAYIYDGGGACNSATALARLGFKVAPYMNVGKDEMGRQIALELTREGADAKYIWVDEELRTGTAVIIVPEGVGDRTILFYSGANRNLGIRDWQKIEDTAWLYVGPINKQSPELLRQITDFAGNKSIKVANNPGIAQIELGYDYMGPILKKLDLLIMNKTEATLLLRSKGPSIKITDNSQLAAELIKLGPKIVVVTCGAEGSYATDGGEIYFQEAIKTDIADVTGAGDSFGSTFLAFLIKDQDIKTAMLMAAINSASVVGKIGAQEGLLKLEELRKRARQLGLKADF